VSVERSYDDPAGVVIVEGDGFGFGMTDCMTTVGLCCTRLGRGPW
jgi:hypothetical protein